MPEVPALALAGWRLQLTSVLLGLGAAVQWRQMVGRRGGRDVTLVASLMHP